MDRRWSPPEGERVCGQPVVRRGGGAPQRGDVGVKTGTSVMNDCKSVRSPVNCFCGDFPEHINKHDLIDRKSVV